MKYFMRMIAAIILLLLLPGQAPARTIAFFPLLDLSRVPNGINTPLTERVRMELLVWGHNLVPADEIMAFLVRHRIRHLGKLTRYQTALLRKEVGVELMLQGTILQMGDDMDPALAVNFELSQTSDGAVIWARNRYLSGADLVSFFGLKDPAGLDDLLSPFFSRLFAALPTAGGRGKSAPDNLNIAKVIIRPKYVRPGELVSCQIRLHDPLEKITARPKLSVKTGGRLYPLSLDDEKKYLTASWPAEHRGGTHPVVVTTVSGSDGAAREWGIGSYSVDTAAPGVRLNIIGTENEGEILFSDKLVILPRLLDPEPISRWQVTVIDEEDETIVIMGDSGTLPKSLTWGGKTSLGNMAPPGIYSITFKVWDRADRQSSAEATVHLLPEPPDILVDVVQEQDLVIVDLDNLVDTPLSYWWAKFFAEDGRLLKLVQGTELPVSIELDVGSQTQPEIQCLLSVRDILGNESRQDIGNLFQLAELDGTETEVSIETDWVEEF